MSVKGNAGFGPAQIPFIRRAGEKAAEGTVKGQLLQVTVGNIISNSERTFFLFRCPKNGILLSGALITNLSFEEDLVVKLRKGTGKDGDNPATFIDITNGVMTIPAVSSFFGEYSVCTPSGNNTFEEGEFISIHVSSNESFFPVTGNISIEIGWS